MLVNSRESLSCEVLKFVVLVYFSLLVEEEARVREK